MANSPMKSLRIRPGSALERMTTGRDWTEAVHRMAEVLEIAMQEEAEANAPKLPGLPPLREHAMEAEAQMPMRDKIAEAENLRAYQMELIASEGYESPRLRELAMLLTADQLRMLAGSQTPGELQPVADIGDDAFDRETAKIVAAAGREMTLVEAQQHAAVEELFDPTGTEREAHETRVAAEQNELVEDLSDLA